MLSAASPGKDAVVNSTTHWVSLEEHFRQHPPRSLRQAQQTIEQRTGLHRGLTQVRAFPAAAGAQAAQGCCRTATAQEHASRTRPGAASLSGRRTRTAASRSPCGPPRRLFCGCQPLRLRLVPRLRVVLCAVVHPGGLGPQALQRAGGVARRQPPVDPGGQPQLHQRHLGVRLAARGRCGQCGASDHAGAGQCPLPEMRYGPGVGPILENPSAVPAFLFAEPEPDRAGVEVRQKECLQSVQHASYEAFTAAIDNCLAKLSTTHKKDMKTLLAHKFQMFDSVSMVAA